MGSLTVLLESTGATAALGRALGQSLVEGDFVGLTGQLGAGKTLFSRAVAEGAGVDADDVSSPTYSIVQSYRGRVLLHHADLYRLTSETDLYSTGFFELLDGEGAFLVEWIDHIPTAAPDDVMKIAIEVTSSTSRTFTFSTSGAKSDQLLRRLETARAAR